MRNIDLFLRDYANTTAIIAFVNVSFDEIVSRYLLRRQEINDMGKLDWIVRSDLIDGKMQSKLDHLLPLINSPGANKELILETSSKWCAYFSNSVNGTDITQIRYSAKIWNLRSTRITAVRDPLSGQPISTQFSLSTPQQDGDYATRSVYAHKEGRWEFGEHGERLPFEEVEAYSSRRIKDRLTPEMVERYCRHLGIELFDPDFYAGRGCVFHTYPVPGATYLDHFPNQKR